MLFSISINIFNSSSISRPDCGPINTNLQFTPRPHLAPPRLGCQVTDYSGSSICGLRCRGKKMEHNELR